MEPIPLAADPAQILTHAKLLAQGFSSHEIRRARSSGELAGLSRGAYCAGQIYQTADSAGQHALTVRAVANGAPHLVVSHISAAVVHGLPLPRPALGQVHLTRPGRSGWRRDGRSIQHAGVLTSSDIVEVSGLRVTSLARTLVDIARTHAFEIAVVAGDHALHTSPAIIDEVVEVLGRARRLRGAGAARRALLFADGRSESPGESRTRVAFHHIGLEPPDLQCDIFDARSTFVARTDLGYLAAGVLIEFDGMVKYGDLLRGNRTAQEVLAREKHREDALRELGWLVVRVTWADLAESAQLARRLPEALDRGRRLVGLGGIVGSANPRPPVRLPR